MTMQVTLVNTSNWEGEDIQVAMMNMYGSKANPSVIKAGEMETMHFRDYSDEVCLVIRKKRSADSKPFRDKDGKQIFPKAYVEFNF